LLHEQKNDLTEVLSRFDETSAVIDNAICHVEKQFGPVADVALDDKVDNNLRQRFDRPDEGLTHLQSQCIVEETRNTGTKRAVPGEGALQGICNFSSVLAPSSYLV
jgi:hypothetical protein